MLVLNRNWQAIDVKTPAEAFAMMATGSATVLDIGPGALRPVSWQEWLALPMREQDAGVGTARGPVRSPTVLVLARYARMPRRRLSFSRRGLWQRDGGICQYSGRSLAYDEANIDHVMPRSRGGAGRPPGKTACWPTSGSITGRATARRRKPDCVRRGVR